jgi:gamma-glutamyltranspeptidase / glutathione hydrolase
MTLSNGVVVAPQPLAVEAGSVILKEGGNAFDAAVATAFVQTVVDPNMCGIAGFGVAHCYRSIDREQKIISFFDRAPKAAHEEMFEPVDVDEVFGDYFPARDHENQVGFKSVSAPGTLKGLFEIHQRYGRLPWRTVMAPAIEQARIGVRLHPDVTDFWHRPPALGNVDALTRLTATKACADIYTNDGRLFNEGEQYTNPDYANTLERVSEEGPDLFYRGEIAREIDRHFKQNGGLLGYDDLAAFSTRIDSPVSGTYRGYRITSTLPPAGGVVLLKVLNMLERFGLANLPHISTDYSHLVASAFTIAFADRAQNWGDPDEVDIDIDTLISKRHAEERARLISLDRKPDTADHVPSNESEDTTHLSVIDRDGNIAAITHTIGLGSGVVVPGLGFMFNNAMHKFDPRPGRPNSVKPGRSRGSTMCPTIMFDGDRPVLALGSPGAFGILTGVCQTILNVVDRGDSPLEAVSRPRLHCEGPAIMLEARYPTWIDRELEQRGHEVRRSVRSYERYVGRVHAAGIDYQTSRATGGADPRTGGVALTDE